MESLKEWQFEEVPKYMEERDPHEDIFFSKGNKAQALVREFVQNALDAKREDSDIVRVCISFDTLSESSKNKYLSGMRRHLEESNMKPESFTEGKNRVMVLEDFGTTGLDGYTQREDSKDNGSKSNFYDFWWSEGKSGKGGGNIGSWGLGKTTYHMASEVKAFWGLTVREDDERELLMGKCLLKSHTLDETVYDYSGKYKRGENRPISDSDIISEFKKDMPILRDSEKGFSVAIPLLEEEITPESVIKYAIKHYFYAILSGDLKLEIRDLNHGDDTQSINRENLEEYARMLDWDDTGWGNRNVIELLNFTREAIERKQSGECKDLDPKNDLQTLEDICDSLETLQERYDNGKFISLKLRADLHKESGEDQDTCFYVFIEKYPERYDMRPDEFYIRSGIQIADEYSDKLGSRSTRVMFVADEDNLSSFLAGAEEPAHLKWNAELEGYKKNHSKAWSTLRFIRNSPSRIVQSLDSNGDERIEDLLQDIFSVDPIADEEPESENEKNDDSEKEGTSEENIPEDIASGKKYTEVKPKGNGIKVKYDRSEEDIPLSRRMKIAYDTYSGDPFNNYETFDFDVSNLQCSKKNVEISKMEKNTVDLEFKSTDSWIQVDGFDPNRDLVVRVVSQ